MNGGLSRSSRSGSLAVLAGPGEEHGGSLRRAGSSKSRSRSRASSPTPPVSTVTSLAPPAAQAQQPAVSHLQPHNSGNSGFVVTSRPKQYTPPGPSPNLPAVPLPLPSPSPPAPGQHQQRAFAPAPTSTPPQQRSQHLSHQESTSSRGSRASSPRASQHHRPGQDPSGSSTASSPPLSSEPKTTLHLSSSIDSKGRRMVNQYVRLKTIGTGTYGKVWLCAEPSESQREDEDEDADAEGGAVPGPGPRSTRELHRWEEETESEGVKYCAIKSVAREGPGRGKSLRVAKGRKAAAASGSSGGIGADDKVKREVAIMKRLDHKNVVRLKEVIDDVKSKKVFMGE